MSLVELPDRRTSIRVRVGAWNCRQGLDRKLDAVAELACDVLVVPECAEDASVGRDPGLSFAWRGEYPSKGLGVVGFNGWTVSPLAEQEAVPWCLPVSVVSPDGHVVCTLLAVWTVQKANRPGYALQFADVLERWGLVIESGRAIVAGDLNASYQGPSSRQNRINIDKVHELGAVSAVHAHQGIEHGADNEPPTLRWIGRGGTPSFFHCDYIFVSQRLASRVVDVSVGAPAVWIESGRSDHCPLTVDLELAPP